MVTIRPCSSERCGRTRAKAETRVPVGVLEVLEIVSDLAVWHRAKSGQHSIACKGPLHQADSQIDPFNSPTLFPEEPEELLRALDGL